MEKIIGLQIIVFMIVNVNGNPCLKSSSECQEIRMPLVSNELKAPLVAELDISAMNKQLKSYIKDDIQLTFSKDIKDMVKSEQNNLKTAMLKDYSSKMKTAKEGYDNNISSIITNLQAKEGKVQEKMSEVLKNLNASEANFNEKMTDLLSGFEHKQESLKLAMLSEYLSKLQVSHDTNNQQIIDLANDLKTQFANFTRNIKDELQTQKNDLEEWKTNMLETMNGAYAPLKFKDCSYMTGKQLKSGVYTIYPNNFDGTQAYCDMTNDGGGWTVIQRRIDGTANFDRTWNEYKEGFGDVEKEYWLGNKYLNILTSSGKYELRVDLVDSNNKETYAVYKTFVVGDENSKYKLTIGDYTGTAGKRNKDELSAEDSRIDELMGILQGICVHENPDKTVKQLLKDTDTILKNINVYKEVVKKNKMLRKELKWIIEESKGQRETSRIVDLIKKGVRDVCISKNKKKYRDCSEISSKRRESGVYTIYPDKSKGIKVYCEITDGKGWTVIQRRIDGSTDFGRTWNEYKEGFGDVRKEYWFGNKYLNILTSSDKYELRVDLVDTNHGKTYAVYKTFVVGDENSKYKLTVGDYTGSAGDRMNYNNGKYFTTKDRDNDSRSGNCATVPTYGPWWNGNCSYVSLNLDLKKQKMRWYDYKFINAVMKIRKIN